MRKREREREERKREKREKRKKSEKERNFIQFLCLVTKKKGASNFSD